MKHFRYYMIYLSLLNLAGFTVISCMKHNASLKIAKANEEVVFGDWNDIKNGKPAQVIYGCDADLKFKEGIILPTTCCSKPENDFYPPMPELKERRK
jgi:hypothetical protein